MMSTANDLVLSYVRALVDDLLDESETLRCKGLLSNDHRQRIAALPSRVAQASTGAEAYAQYRTSRNELATLLDGSYELAATYESMDDFWADAAAQEAGASYRTYWDSYEHGLRRSLECDLAAGFGSDQAVLVNSGMAALDVAFRSVGLRPGSTVLAHEKAYFESDDYMAQVATAAGISVERVDMTDTAAVRSALDSGAEAALVEPVLNGPSCDVPVLEPLLTAGISLIVDNSPLSHSLPADILRGHSSPVLVIESGSKYLCREASSGVLYGWGEFGASARHTARRIGAQLQGRALHRLRPGEIRRCRTRVAAHAESAALFQRALIDEAPHVRVSGAGHGALGREDVLARALRSGAGSSLLYVIVPGDEAITEATHRTIISTWSRRNGARVRAGFGWTMTTGRSYGRDALNTDAGRAFLRLSVGLEPAQEVERLARSLGRLCHDEG